MNKTAIKTAKFLLSIAVLWTIYRYFIFVEKPEIVWNTIKNIPLWLYLIGIFSATLNWGLEAKKWQIMIQQLERISYFVAVKCTCAGAAVSNIFPFKVGEYLGRVIFMQPQNRLAAAANSIVGSATQLFCAILLGVPAALYMLPSKYHWVALSAMAALLIIPLAILGVIKYFKIHSFKNKHLKKLAEDIRQFTISQLLQILGLSGLRYVVFASFYVLLLYQVGISSNILTLYTGVATVYLLQSFAPSMAITDAGFRTAIPLIVFSIAKELNPILFAAALVNYSLNIIVPSLFGLIFIISSKLNKP